MKARLKASSIFASLMASVGISDPLGRIVGRHAMSHMDRNKYNKMLRIKRTEARQRRGSQYARDHRGEPGRNGGPKGM